MAGARQRGDGPQARGGQPEVVMPPAPPGAAIFPGSFICPTPGYLFALTHPAGALFPWVSN